MPSTPGAASDAGRDDSSSFSEESLGLSRVHSNPLFTEDTDDAQTPACSMSGGLQLHGALSDLPSGPAVSHSAYHRRKIVWTVRASVISWMTHCLLTSRFTCGAEPDRRRCESGRCACDECPGAGARHIHEAGESLATSND